jgi:hypothetical protein
VDLKDYLKTRQDKKRQAEDEAYKNVISLPGDSRIAVMERLYAFFEHEAEVPEGEVDETLVTTSPEPSRTSPQPPPSSVHVPEPVPSPTVNTGSAEVTYTEKARAYLQQHPEGATTRAVADAIGQAPTNADSTLRYASRQGTVIRRDGLWFLAGSPVVRVEPKPKRTLRDLITEVLSNSDEPLGSGDIGDGVEQLKPGVNHGSVSAELLNMKKDGEVVVTGQGARGALYALAASGGDQPSTG